MTKIPPAARPADPHAATVAALEAERDRLNADWTRYRSVQPIAPGAIAPGAFDPTRLVEKFRLGVGLDALNVRLETARAEQARAQLAALLHPAEDARLTAEKDAAYGRLTEARAALAEAERGYRGAAGAVRDRADRIGRAKERATAAEAAAERWRKELDRDRAILAQYEDAAKRAA